MISASDRRTTVQLIEESRAAGASCERACHEVGISMRTDQRWMQGGRASQDRRPKASVPRQLTNGRCRNATRS